MEWNGRELSRKEKIHTVEKKNKPMVKNFWGLDIAS